MLESVTVTPLNSELAQAIPSNRAPTTEKLVCEGGRQVGSSSSSKEATVTNDLRRVKQRSRKCLTRSLSVTRIAISERCEGGIQSPSTLRSPASSRSAIREDSSVHLASGSSKGAEMRNLPSISFEICHARLAAA